MLLNFCRKGSGGLRAAVNGKDGCEAGRGAHCRTNHLHLGFKGKLLKGGYIGDYIGEYYRGY